MTACINALLIESIRRGHMAGKRIVLIDDETKERNIYEDLDQETVTSPRMVLITLEPSFSKARNDANGKEGEFQITVTHEKALSDIQKSMKIGWRLLSLDRDLGERTVE